ncbi:8572_t:CDS:2 [Cetraspora pellucida]|uniref:8572_t:CDS:1 n=1 Tax=Cetraspora pellucida TaxID=1433469 RepID=A0A9N9PH96_9GLOM|nr:8572_t:CDS:2 [Cetraspora pellucida]
MSLKKVIESYESTTTVIDNNENKEIEKIDVCLNYTSDILKLMKELGVNVKHDK